MLAAFKHISSKPPPAASSHSNVASIEAPTLSQTNIAFTPNRHHLLSTIESSRDLQTPSLADAGSQPDYDSDSSASVDFSEYLRDANLTKTRPLLDAALTESSFHPAVTLATTAAASVDPSAMTIVVYNSIKSQCTNLAVSLAAHYKRVLKTYSPNTVHDVPGAIDLIVRNNSDPTRTRNSVRFVVLALDNTAVAIIRHVSERLTDPKLARMEVIPILLVVKEETLVAAKRFTEGGAGTASVDMLTQALQYKVVCGYVPNTTSARDIAAIVTRISKRSKGVFAAYEDLRVSAGEFSYPKYWGEREDDEVVEEDDNEDGDAPPGINKLGYAFHTPTGFFVPTAKQAFANDELLKKVWKGVKASGKEGNLLKQLGMGVIHGNNAAKASQAMKALIGGGGQFQFDEEAMKRKQKNLTALKPKVGLAALRLRPKLYRKFAKNLPASTPKNQLGFFVVEPDDQNQRRPKKHGGSLQMRHGASSFMPENPVPTTPGGSEMSKKALLIAPEMRPFIMHHKPEPGSPRTSCGLSTKKVKVLRKLLDAHKEAKYAKLGTGAKRIATGAEKILAMDNKEVMKQAFAANNVSPEKEIKEKEAVRRASNFAMKLKSKMLARRASKDEDAEAVAEPAASKVDLFGAVVVPKKDYFADMFGQPSTATAAKPGNRNSEINIAQVIIAAMAKKKQENTMSSVLADAKAMPPDMLQYDLIEVKPSHSSSINSCNHLLRSGYEFQVAKNYVQARNFFSKAVMADRRCVTAWFCRGVANDKQGDFFKALQDFGNCLKIELEKLSRKKYNAMENEKYNVSKRGAKKKPERSVMDSVDEGASVADDANANTLSSHSHMGEDPHDVTLTRIYFNRALVYVHLGDDEAALADLDHAVKEDPKDRIARGARAMIFRRQGNFLESQADYVRLDKQKEDERQKRLIEEATKASVAYERKTAKGHRPQSAPGGGRTPTRMELEDAMKDPEYLLKIELKKQFKKAEAESKQRKRESRGGTLGGLASTIDQTPPASPTRKVLVTMKEKVDLNHLDLSKMDDVELVDSGDDDDDEGGDAVKVVRQSTARTLQQVLFSTKNSTSVFNTNSTPMTRRSSLMTPMGKGGGFASDDEQSMYGIPNLAAFKAQNNVDADIFDQLFSIPTELQKALLVPPTARKKTDLNQIVRMFQGFDLTSKFDSEVLRELSGVCEYRTVNSKMNAFLQGEEADALTFVLSGKLSIKMTDTHQIAHCVGELGAGDHFGDYSLLMRLSSVGCDLFSRATKKQGGGEEEGEDGGKDAPGGEEERKRRKNSAPLRESYFCETPCELLLIMKDDFDRHFRTVCNQRQKEKFQILKRSKIFKGWTVDAIVRLSRMARAVVLPRLEKPVKQGQKCESMYFISKGICKVFKFPDRVSQLRREKEELQKQLDFSRTRYSYHRSMREPQKGGKGKRMLAGEVAKATQRIDGGEGVWVPHDHVTLGEKAQMELERNIRACERRIEKFRREEEGVEEKEEKELFVLVAPSFFGAESVTDPESGEAFGTVMTDTVVHCLVVHKLMIQAFDIGQEFLDNVERRSTSYPDDIALKGEMDAERGWDRFRGGVMMDIKKSKWNVKAHGSVVVQLPGGKSVVKQGMGKTGDLLRGVL